MGQADMRRGWCPGVLRPMETGDGLLARIRITGGRLTPDEARAIAALARSCGSGLIDLSARGNLQLRGVRSDALPQLEAGLAALGFLDDDPVSEQVRNVLLAPLTGLGVGEAMDLTELAQALEAALRADTALHALPGKFGFALDDGGPVPLPLKAFDIGLLAGKDLCHLTLAGQVAGAVVPEDALAALLALARLFLRHRTAEERRMSALLARLPAARLGREAGLSLTGPLPARAAPPLLGEHTYGRLSVIGVGLPFGRLTADDLEALANAEPHSLRLTPHRAILAVEPREELSRRAFLFDDNDPLRRVAACSGAPFCASASRAVQEEARLFAAALTPRDEKGICLHLSGCAKGCAHPGPAPLTLVAEQGLYSLVRQGRAGDEPQKRGLSLDAALQECR